MRKRVLYWVCSGIALLVFMLPAWGVGSDELEQIPALNQPAAVYYAHLRIQDLSNLNNLHSSANEPVGATHWSDELLLQPFSAGIGLSMGDVTESLTGLKLSSIAGVITDLFDLTKPAASTSASMPTSISTPRPLAAQSQPVSLAGPLWGTAALVLLSAIILWRQYRFKPPKAVAEHATPVAEMNNYAAEELEEEIEEAGPDAAVSSEHPEEMAAALLNLATIYIDIGDIVGAKNKLSRVMAIGTVEQCKEAEVLLQQLNTAS